MFENISIDDLEEGRKYLMSGSVGGGLPIVVESGKGSVLTDINGKKYIDCTSQAWSFNIGFSHPRVIEAVKEQAEKISHVRTSFDTVPKLLLLKKLGEIAPGNLKKIMFSLHGSVSNESALKLALINRPGATKFVTVYNNYSGRTFATIAASWVYPPISKLFAPYMENFVRIPNAYCYRCHYNLTYPKCGLFCAEFLKTTFQYGVEPVAAVTMEPMQAQGGQIDYPEGYLKRIREICNEFGVLLIFDEIQTSLGRMGCMWASEMYDVIPDIMVFGKALGGGYPLAGTMQRADMEPPAAASDSYTFAHFPISFAAACATLDVLKDENLIERSRKMGQYFTVRLKELQNKYDIIGDIRGPGLMIGVELVKDRQTKEPAREITNTIVKEAIYDGVIFGESLFKGLGNVLKIKPPLVITEAEADKVLEVFEKHIKKHNDSLKK
jgi:4-aminobutyrate aminotransferase-like enzyme